jgi:tetratricopeptide (TPR) repeat protein
MPGPADLLRSALRLHNAGQLPQAQAIYHQILAADPNQPDALHLLGVLTGQMGNPRQAAELISRAIALSPKTALYHQSLAEAFGHMGQLEQAEKHLQRALDLNPDFPIAVDRMGNLQRHMGKLPDALALFQRYTQLAPNSAEGFNNIGVCLRELGRTSEAVAAYGRAIELNPKFAEAHNNLAVCLHDLRDLAGAQREYETAIELRPDFAEARNNLATVRQARGDLAGAVAAFRQAIEVRPDFAGAHYHLSLALLLQGNFAEGWLEHEWRWQSRGFPSRKPELSQPAWDGQELDGKAILIYCEQGFGDSIQFIRYVPMLQARGAHVILWCPPELRKLFVSIKALQLISKLSEAPGFDYQCALLSLPRVFATRLETIPATTPYLAADAADVDRWRQKLSTDEANLKIGIAWAGRPTHPNDRQRSIHLETLEPLWSVSGCSYYSLQKGDGPGKSPGMKPIDLTVALDDFAETAALIANLDLVISIDSAVAHLAGALGRPTWVMLPFAPDWRWLLEREDSPWYPTMRLFRQKKLDDWTDPIARVKAALENLASQKRR